MASKTDRQTGVATVDAGATASFGLDPELAQLLNPENRAAAAETQRAQSQAERQAIAERYAANAQGVRTGTLQVNTRPARSGVVLPPYALDERIISGLLPDEWIGGYDSAEGFVKGLNELGGENRPTAHASELRWVTELKGQGRQRVVLYFNHEDGRRCSNEEVLLLDPDTAHGIFALPVGIDPNARNWDQDHMLQSVAWTPGRVDNRGRGVGYTLLARVRGNDAFEKPFDLGIKRFFMQTKTFIQFCEAYRDASVAQQILQRLGAFPQDIATADWFAGMVIYTRSRFSESGAKMALGRQIMNVSIAVPWLTATRKYLEPSDLSGLEQFRASRAFNKANPVVQSGARTGASQGQPVAEQDVAPAGYTPAYDDLPVA